MQPRYVRFKGRGQGSPHLNPPQPTPPHLTLPPVISDIALIVYLSPHWSADYGGLFVDFGVEGAKAGGSVTVPRLVEVGSTHVVHT